jgi:hypothetical protein
MQNILLNYLLLLCIGPSIASHPLNFVYQGKGAVHAWPQGMKPLLDGLQRTIWAC